MPKVSQVLEAASNMIQSLTDDKKSPLHVGEVMACWTYLAFVENIVTFEEVGLNTTTDTGLKELYKEALHTANRHQKELSEFMRKEGIELPPSPEHKPKSDPAAIPLGVKFTDDELVNTLNVNFVYAANTCAQAASQSLRADVGMMFIKFQTDKLTLGLKSKELMRKKGWLKTPPLYQPPGAPITVSEK